MVSHGLEKRFSYIWEAVSVGTVPDFLQTEVEYTIQAWRDCLYIELVTWNNTPQVLAGEYDVISMWVQHLLKSPIERNIQNCLKAQW